MSVKLIGMSKIRAMFSLVLFVSLALPLDAWSASKLLIKNVTVVSPHRIGRHQVNDVLIVGDKIKEIAPKIKVKKGTQTIDGTRKFLIPGLIDGNVHLQSVPGMTQEMAAQQTKLRAIYYRQMPLSYLLFGFTTVVDQSVRDKGFIKDLTQLELRPDIYHCGTELTPNKDYSKKAIKQIRKNNGRCAKISFDKTWSGPEENAVSLSQLKSIRDHASKAKLPMFVQANSLEAYQIAVQIPPSGISLGLWDWGKFNGFDGVAPKVRSVLDQVVEKKISYMPAFRAVGSVRDVFNSKIMKSKAYRASMPPELVQWFSTREGRWFRKSLVKKDKRMKSSQGAMKVLNASRLQGQNAAKYVADFSGQILFGTATPSTASPMHAPGYSGFRELVAMQRADLGLDTIFKAVTINNARAFGIESEVGSVESKKVANLLLLRENPLKTIKAYSMIDGVILRGKHYVRPKFIARRSRF